MIEEEYMDFVMRHISVDDSEKKPFCPFEMIQCDDAYSNYCIGCRESLMAFCDMYDAIAIF